MYIRFDSLGPNAFLTLLAPKNVQNDEGNDYILRQEPGLG